MSGSMGNDAMLQRALADLWHHWHATESVWHDDARDLFARQRLDPMDDHARQAIKAASQLEALLAQALRQCQ